MAAVVWRVKTIPPVYLLVKISIFVQQNDTLRHCSPIMLQQQTNLVAKLIASKTGAIPTYDFIFSLSER